MNMNDIEYFLRVAELKSFSKAAEELYVTQQAVSLHIKHLEETYAVQLFERHPAVKLTPAGELLLAAAWDIINRETQLYSAISESRSKMTGEISIGLPPNRSTAFATEFMPLFCEAYPNMSIRLDERTSANLSAAVKRNEIDLALPMISDYSGAFDPAVFHVQPLETESLYLIISDKLLEEAFPDSYPECKQIFRSGVSLFDFAKLPMFLHPATSHLHETIVDKLMMNGTPPFIRIRTSLTSSLLPLCVDGYGIFFSAPMLLKYLYESNKQAFRTLNVFPVLEYRENRMTVLIYHWQKMITQPLADAMRMIQTVYQGHTSFMGRFAAKSGSKTLRKLEENELDARLRGR